MTIPKPSIADWFGPGQQRELGTGQLDLGSYAQRRAAIPKPTTPGIHEYYSPAERRELAKQSPRAADALRDSERAAKRAAKGKTDARRDTAAIKKRAKERARKLRAELGVMGDALHPLGDLLDKWAPLRAKHGIPPSSFDAIKRHVSDDLKTVALARLTHNPESQFHTEVYGSAMALKLRARKLRRWDWASHSGTTVEDMQSEIATMRRIIENNRERLAGIIKTGHHSWT